MYYLKEQKKLNDTEINDDPDFIQVKEIVFNKIYLWANNNEPKMDYAYQGILINHPNFSSILYPWKVYGNNEKLNDYIDKIIKNDNHLILFLTHLLSESKTQSFGSYTVNNEFTFDIKKLKDFIEPDNIINKLKDIKQSKKYNSLEINQKLAIDEFIKQYKKEKIINTKM